jgi:hypothetical protein
VCRTYTEQCLGRQTNVPTQHRARVRDVVVVVETTPVVGSGVRRSFGVSIGASGGHPGIRLVPEMRFARRVAA